MARILTDSQIAKLLAEPKPILRKPRHDHAFHRPPPSAGVVSVSAATKITTRGVSQGEAGTNVNLRRSLAYAAGCEVSRIAQRVIDM